MELFNCPKYVNIILYQLLKNAEDALKQKIAELERFNNLTIDRELKMIEMKKEVNLLMARLGEKEKYKIVE